MSLFWRINLSIRSLVHQVGLFDLKGAYYAFPFFPSPIALYICFGVYKWLAKLQYQKIPARGSKLLPQITFTELPRNGSLGFSPRLSFTSGTW